VLLGSVAFALVGVLAEDLDVRDKVFRFGMGVFEIGAGEIGKAKEETGTFPVPPPRFFAGPGETGSKPGR
jgi:hypothetical protein